MDDIAGKYLVARAPCSKDEEILSEGRVHPGWSRVSVNLEVSAGSEDDLIEALRKEIADREIDPDECHGLQGFSEQYEGKYPNWGCDTKLGPRVAVIWHPAAVIPPCTCLQDDAVIYGVLND